MIPRKRTGEELVIERTILEQVFQFWSCSTVIHPSQQS